jgi:hypothetical protein
LDAAHRSSALHGLDESAEEEEGINELKSAQLRMT